jgi:SAM-dependent MidA family methyltransferase
MQNLPEPGADALAQSAALKALISREIIAHGAISFARYVELTQYAPGLGYYAAGAQKFAEQGKLQGDFVTAPELGSVFAGCIAKLVAPIFSANASAVFLELGAGSGALACALIPALDAMNALPAAYWILERSADLRDRQQVKLKAQLPDYFERVCWLDHPPVEGWCGVLFGNEVVDALPFERFEITEAGPMQLCVALNPAGEFCLQLGEPLLAAKPIQEISELAPGYQSELQPQLGAWLSGIVENFRQGLVLLIDYGYTRSEYYLPERSAGTLVCHYQHRMFDNAFIYPGLVDISCSVDFTALAQAGLQAGLQLVNYCSQSQLLRSAGLAELLLARNFEAMPQRERSALTAEVRMLSLPGEMGERMQAMAWTRALPDAQRHVAFDLPDWRYRL